LRYLHTFILLLMSKIKLLILENGLTEMYITFCVYFAILLYDIG